MRNGKDFDRREWLASAVPGRKIRTRLFNPCSNLNFNETEIRAQYCCWVPIAMTLEIGCGGTILQMAAKWPNAKFVWVTFSSGADREAETRLAASELLAGARDAIIDVRDFRGSYFPHDGEKIKDYFETLKRHQPDLILTHYRQDLHQDHRVINELTWNTFRNHLVLEYEIPKFDGDFGIPNMFVPLTKSELDRKIDI